MHNKSRRVCQHTHTRKEEVCTLHRPGTTKQKARQVCNAESRRRGEATAPPPLPQCNHHHKQLCTRRPNHPVHTHALIGRQRRTRGMEENRDTAAHTQTTLGGPRR